MAPPHSWPGSLLPGRCLSSRGYDSDSNHESVAGFSHAAVLLAQSGIAHYHAFQCPVHCRSTVVACYGTGAESASVRSGGQLVSDRYKESDVTVSRLCVSG